MRADPRVLRSVAMDGSRKSFTCTPGTPNLCAACSSQRPAKKGPRPRTIGLFLSHSLMQDTTSTAALSFDPKTSAEPGETWHGLFVLLESILCACSVGTQENVESSRSLGRGYAETEIVLRGPL